MNELTMRVRDAEQAGDDLLGKFLRGEPITDDFIGSYRPPDIRDVCDGLKTIEKGGRPRLVPRDWTPAERRLKASFKPQPILSYDVREQIKQRAYVGPGPHAHICEWIQALLDIAFAHWSRAVAQGETKLSFAEWIRGYLVDELWHDADPENWTGRFDPRFSKAAQTLRLSMGLPRYRPSSRPAS